MKLTTRKATVGIGAATAVVLLAGIAAAYYIGNVTGTGTGAATTANTTVQDLTFAVSSASNLVPGGSASATISFTNPNAFAVQYPAKTISVSSVSGPTGCADNTVALLSGSANWAGGVLTANQVVTLPITISMADSATVNQNACNNKSFTITYSAS